MKDLNYFEYISKLIDWVILKRKKIKKYLRKVNIYLNYGIIMINKIYLSYTNNNVISFNSYIKIKISFWKKLMKNLLLRYKT